MLYRVIPSEGFLKRSELVVGFESHIYLSLPLLRSLVIREYFTCFRKKFCYTLGKDVDSILKKILLSN